MFDIDDEINYLSKYLMKNINSIEHYQDWYVNLDFKIIKINISNSIELKIFWVEKKSLFCVIFIEQTEANSVKQPTHSLKPNLPTKKRERKNT